MDPEAYRQKIEADIIQIMEEKLSKGEMDVGRAKAIARMLLDKLHPPLNLEQIYSIVPTLDDHFTELSQAVFPIMKEHDEEIEEIVVAHAEKLIKSGKFDEAHALLKDANSPKA